MRNTLMLIFGVVIVGLLNFGVLQKQQVLENGDHLYLELRPADPRSLMQGDFMRLRYDVAAKAATALKDKTVRSGDIVVRRDEQSVAQFSRIDDGRELQNNEYKIHFSNSARQLTLVPNSFFFQEGDGSDFSDAEYALFTYDESRTSYVLSALVDENFALINPRDALGWGK